MNNIQIQHGVCVCVCGHGCVFACQRPCEWESQALLGLTAASWGCSRKSCWICSCLLAASLCGRVCVCVSVCVCASARMYKAGCWSSRVGSLMIYSSALTLCCSGLVATTTYMQHLTYKKIGSDVSLSSPTQLHSDLTLRILRNWSSS